MSEAVRRRDFLALEERRMRGARLLREGVWQAEVARRVGVQRQSVSRWARKLKRGGERALGAGRLGRPARLHREDLRRLDSRLKRGSGAVGHGRWTSGRVAELIERECRVKYDASQAWRILRRLGWSWRRGGGGWRQWGRGGG
jgi:transposase